MLQQEVGDQLVQRLHIPEPQFESGLSRIFRVFEVDELNRQDGTWNPASAREYLC